MKSKYIKLKLISELIKKKFVSDVIFGVIGQVFVGISGIIINVIIGNYYNTEGLGIFSQVLSIYIILSLISLFGLNKSVLKYCAEHSVSNDLIANMFSSALVIVSIFSSFLALAILPILIYFPNSFNNEDVAHGLLHIVYIIPLFSVNKLFEALLNGFREMKKHSIIITFRWLGNSLIILAFSIMEVDLYALFYSFLVVELFILFYFLITKYKYLNISFIRNRNWLKEHIDFGSKTILSQAVIQFNLYIDILIIGMFLGNHYAGVYSIAIVISRGLILLPSVVQQNFNPIISNLWAKKEVGQLNIFVKKVRKTNFLIMAPVIIGALLLYPLFVNILMDSPDYRASIPVFYILMIGFSVFSMFTWSGAMLMMGGFLIDNLKRVVIFLFLTILSNAILIPIWGIEGAAAATSFSIIVALFLLRYYIKKNMGIKIF